METKDTSFCGWILPCGSWRSTAPFWHIMALYDLRDEERYPCLTTPKAQSVLQTGDEGIIRNWVAQQGFVKLSPYFIDGISLNPKQLETLQECLGLLSPDDSIQIYHPTQGLLKTLTVRKLLKMKNSALVFENAH
jgi:hypothetical protein